MIKIVMDRIIATEMQARKYEIICGEDNCHGRLEFTGAEYERLPPLYEHKCNNCGDISQLDKKYPYIDYSEK